jgi:S1-C subfamily serine protease
MTGISDRSSYVLPRRPSSPSIAERSFGALLAFGCFVLIALVGAPTAQAQSPVTEVIHATEDAVVRVSVRFNRPKGARVPEGQPSYVSVVRPSSGVFISHTGLVLTNAHLVDEIPDGPASVNPEFWLVVTRPNGISYDATVVARDERTDLALLQVDMPQGRSMPALPLGSIQGRVEGERVIALGQADRILTHAFAGALAFADGPVKLNDALLEPGEVVHTDARFHDLLDGAPLIDTRGQILGLHNSSHLSSLPPGFGHDPDSDEPPPVSTDYAVIVSADAVSASFAEQLKDLVSPNIPIAEPIADVAVAAIGTIAPSVVSVWTGEPDAAPSHADPADPHCQRIAETQGSGVVVDASGLVLTSSDLFEKDAESALVRLASGESYTAKVLKISKRKNIALLQVELPEGTTLPAAELADSILAGEYVSVVARPNSSLTLSVGVLSAVERQGRVQLASWIHAGHWGGALVDRQGRLLGIAVDQPTVAERADSESYLGFAAPITSLRSTFEEHWPVGETAAASETTEFGDRRNAVARVVEATQSSLVNVIVSKAKAKESSGFDPFADEGDDEFEMLGQGSGVIIHESGLAISNWHVVDAAMSKGGGQADDHEVKVTLPDGREFQVQVLSTSRDDDLALLKILLPEGEEVTPVELGDSDALDLGEIVIAIGNPLGLANSASAGIVSAKNLEVKIQGRLHPYEGMLMTDAAINPGNSGGALLDAQGRLVGINSAGRTGAGMAIPVNKARDVFSGKLLSAEKLRSTYLGLKVEERGVNLRIREVDPAGPGAAAGLERRDVILSMGGEDISTEIAFAQIQLSAKHGKPIPIRVMRGRDEISTEIMPLSFAAWTIERQCGVQVEPLDFAIESDAVRDAGLALHRAYTGNSNAKPSSLMGGALRVTQVTQLDEDREVLIEPGDLFLGMTTVVRQLGGDSTELTRFENVAGLSAALNPLATRVGHERTFWVLRGDRVLKFDLYVKRP